MEFVYFWSKLHIQILFTKYSKTSSRWFDALKSFTGILFGIFLNDNFPPIWPYSSIFVKVANMEKDNVADKEVDKVAASSKLCEFIQGQLCVNNTYLLLAFNKYIKDFFFAH